MMHTYAAKGIGAWQAIETDPQAFTDVWQILADNSEMNDRRRSVTSFDLTHYTPRHAKKTSVNWISSNDLVNFGVHSASLGRHAKHDVEMEMSAEDWEDALMQFNEGEHAGELSLPWSPSESFIAGALWQKHRDASRDVF